MIEPDLDEPLADRQRNQALRGLTRNAELARDLVLGVAGDIVEPPGASGLVEPQSIVIRLARHGFQSAPKASARAARVATRSGSRAISSKRSSAPASVKCAPLSRGEK